MSTMLLTKKHYKAIYQKACSYQHRDVVDINHCRILAQTESQIKLFVLNLFWMNYLSYCTRYGKEIDESIFEDMREEIKKWNYDTMREPSINSYQMLKALECVHYNIDEVWNDNQNYKILCRALTEIRCNIINAIDDYQKAKWSIE